MIANLKKWNSNWPERFIFPAGTLTVAVVVFATAHAAPRTPKPDVAASRAAFLQVYKVFTSPRCQNCHQSTNVAGEHMPPGNPKWSLPPPENKMVFVGRSPAELCRQLKDSKQTGGRNLQQIFEHVSTDDLVGWAWNPGDGRVRPPLSRADTVAQLRIWIDGGAACPG